MNEASPYPFERTVCACRLCGISCEHMPGALALGDVERIAHQLGYDDVERFARECLQVSDGAKVIVEDGGTVSLPTLVPAAQENGQCRFLSDGRCTIHAVSPFGCACIDAHLAEGEFQRRADWLYRALLEDQLRSGLYSQLCGLLRQGGQCAPPLETRRYRLMKAMRREGLGR